MSVFRIKVFALVFMILDLVMTQEDIKYICDINDQTDITIGKNVTLCIHFKEAKQRMAFKIKVDEYSVISIGGGFSLADKLNKKKNGANPPVLAYPDGTSLLAQVAENITYFPSLYLRDSSDPTLIPLFNLVIKVNEGKIYDIVWDNDCFSCQTSQCINETVKSLNTSLNVNYQICKSQVICQNTQEEGLICDPKFYITWFGTDANKRQLKSSNLAMSKFKQYSIGSLYESAISVFNTTYATMQGKWVEIQKAIDGVIKPIN